MPQTTYNGNSSNDDDDNEGRRRHPLKYIYIKSVISIVAVLCCIYILESCCACLTQSSVSRQTSLYVSTSSFLFFSFFYDFTMLYMK